MRKSWLWNNAVTLATLVMAGTAIVALIYAHLQIVESRRAEREANANELWRETLRLGFENSKLSDPTLRQPTSTMRNSRSTAAGNCFRSTRSMSTLC